MQRPELKITQIMCSAFHHVVRMGGNHHDGMAAAYLAVKEFESDPSCYGTTAHRCALAIVSPLIVEAPDPVKLSPWHHHEQS